MFINKLAKLKEDAVFPNPLKHECSPQWGLISAFMPKKATVLSDLQLSGEILSDWWKWLIKSWSGGGGCSCEVVTDYAIGTKSLRQEINWGEGSIGTPPPPPLVSNFNWHLDAAQCLRDETENMFTLTNHTAFVRWAESKDKISSFGASNIDKRRQKNHVAAILSLPLAPLQNRAFAVLGRFGCWLWMRVWF